MSKEAMKQALEALEGIHPGNMTPMAEEYWNKAINALREALAEQPAQRKPLTREVIERDFYGRIDFVRAIEAAHGIKENT